MRPVRTPKIPLALALAAALGGCSEAPAARTSNDVPTLQPAVTTEIPPLSADGAGAPKTLPGVDTDKLTGREMRSFLELVQQLYAPCPEQAVSIAQCVEESRPCAACRPAASLLADKVHAGATPEEGRAVYKARFGPDLKKVDAADSPSRGPADAPVQILVWSDFQCPHCRAAMPILDRIFEKFSPKVRLVHKFYPLRGHTRAEPSARAAIAAQNQGRYWEMERLLFGHQDRQEDTDLEGYAKELKLDLKRFHADMDADRTKDIIKRDHGDAERSGLSGTPFILINGREFDLSLFHMESDLEAWIALEIELGAPPPMKTASP
jgi:protein-disulfide isomerase